MRRVWRKWACLTASLLFLAACDTETEEPSTENGEDQEEASVEEEGETSEEVISNIQEALEEVESYSVRLNLLQILDGEEEAEVLVGMDLDATHEPARISGDASLNDQLEGRSMEIDLFYTEEESYSRNHEVGYWTTENNIHTENMVPAIFQKELELLLEKNEFVEMEESGSEYILTLHVSEEDAADIPLSVTLPFVLGEQMTVAGGLDPEETSEEYTIEAYEYELRVDKDTYLTYQITQ